MMRPMRMPVNILYFGGFFSMLLLTITTSVLLKENLEGSRLFFWFYAVCQSALEITMFILCAWLIERFLGRLAFWMFIAMTFSLAMLHVFDFLMDLMLNLSVWDALRLFVLDESFANFLFLLDASGIALWIWGLFFVSILLLPLVGMGVYHALQRRTLQVRPETLWQVALCLPAALLFWDYSASRVIHPNAYTEFAQVLPWKRTFLKPKTVQLNVKSSLKHPESEETIAQQIASFKPLAEKTPSIFLFITESLREDFITPETAPNLSAFRETNIRGQTSLSNANATQLSWFSILHSQLPFSWRKACELGSPALALFKQLGYKIRVYSSAQLNYYGMEQLLFGKETRLLDSYQTFHHVAPNPAYESDRQAMTAVQKDLAADPSLAKGNLFIVFLDTTHFGYSWPQEASVFQPFATEFAYLQGLYSKKTVELIKNRYRNAIHYVDSLFGEFLRAAPADALIAFTGDHGEEFLDHGHLFHGSHLSHEQMNVPIYLRIGGVKKTVPLLSQVDILPTLLDGVSGLSASFLEGESALNERTRSFVTTARYNASRPPFEFSIHNGRAQLVARFDDAHNIFEAKKLQILSLRDCQRKMSSEYTREWVQNEFGAALQRLFP